MEFYVGQKVFIVERHRISGSIPEKRTVEKVNSRFVTLDSGAKFNVRTGRTWGVEYHRAGAELAPWTEERQAEYERQAAFERSVRHTHRLLYYLGEQERRLRFKDLETAQAAQVAVEELYRKLADLEVIKPLGS